MDTQRTFGPPPVIGYSINLVKRRHDWYVVVRTCRDGAGWSHLEQREYGPMSLGDSIDVASDVLISFDV